MSAKSENIYDVHKWIKDVVIPSCITMEQSDSINKLLSNFLNQYQSNSLMSKRLYDELKRELSLHQHNLRIKGCS